MRIALDATYSLGDQPSGIAVYSRELMDGLARQHPEHEYVRAYRWKQWRELRSRELAGRLLLPPLPTFRADVFHALNQRVDKRLAGRVVSTFHDLFVFTADYSSSDFRRRFSAQATQAAQLSDQLIAVSQFTAGQLQSVLNVSPDRITVIPHGVRAPREEPPAVHSRRSQILFVGALQKRKNVKRLVEAFEAVPREWQLVLAGATTGYGADEALAAVDASAARERIQVLGYVTVSELERLYREAAIFAFPSLDEGFGMPVLDAMAHGVPVLTTNGSALREVGEGAAMLVDPLRTDEIAESLQRLTHDPDLRNELTRAGRLRAALYSWERTCSQTCAVYSGMAA